MDRRKFLKGVAGAAMTPAVAATASPEEKSTPAELAAWKASLFERGEPRAYRALFQPQAAFPTGGIGCGNVYLGAGGHLKDWLLFNNTAPVQIPNSFFAIRAAVAGREPVARMLQTETQGLQVIGAFGGTFHSGVQRSSGPGPGVRDVELRGDYPLASLRYLDPALPVEVRMEAFTPWVPLDARTSAMPGTGFLFHLRNPGDQEATVTLLGSLHNAAGHGEPGGNYGEAWREGSTSGVRLAVKAGRPAHFDRPAELQVSGVRFDLPHVEKPERLTVKVLPDSPRAADLRRSGKGAAIYWLEDLHHLDADAAVALRKEVESGATLLVSGTGAGLLAAWGGALHAPVNPRPDVVYEDWESGTYSKWEVKGKAFGDHPQTGTMPGQQPVTGFHGKYLVNSFTDGDAPTGRLTSQPFPIERRYIRFLIGGGAHAGRTCMNLLVDGKVVRSATGREAEHLDPAAWDVAALQGRTGRLEIVDEETTGWGHINIDDIIFSDQAGETLAPPVVRELKELLPVSYDAATWLPGGVTLSWAAREKEPEKELRLTGRLQVDGARLMPESHVLAGAAGEPMLWRRSVGKGSVLLLAAPLFPAEQRGSRAVREQALEAVALAGGLRYEAGKGLHPEAPSFGELCLSAVGERVSGLPSWDDAGQLWETFAAGKLPDLRSGARSTPTPTGLSSNAALAVTVTIPAHGEATVPFFLTWHFPNYYFGGARIGNRYATHWQGAREAAASFARDWKEHRQKTEQFRQTAYDTPLPYWLVDCLTSQASTIRSEVCVWAEDGTFAGYEGADGCCPMNCSHVWGYEQSLSRLFPDLEKAMRNTDFMHQQRTDGGINNRVALPVQPGPTGEIPFADGHASEVLKAYREHLNSPNMDWLRDYWPRVKRAVEYLVQLDGAEPDGVIEGPQPNTYDCTVFGANTFIGSYYLAALRAGEEMARLMNDGASATRWHALFQAGQKNLVARCWNGEYFHQDLPDYASRATQWGPGCLSDQLIGQWWAHQLRLGYLLPKEMVRSSLKAVFQHNWLWDFSEFRHRQRVYADLHDKGLLNCTWPRGGRPRNPILYCDEVWTGVEYQVAGHMLYEGMLEEAFTIVRGARERYDGRRRNPWNELECGGHYARAMSSWALLLALSGFHQDAPKGLLCFAPCFRPEQFRSLFTAAEGWGSFHQERTAGRQRNEVRVEGGRLRLKVLELGAGTAPTTVRTQLGARTLSPELNFESGRVRLVFPQEVEIAPSESLIVELS